MHEIKIYKKERMLELWDDEQLIHSFKIGLGFTPSGGKTREGDGKTPEGEYYVCTKNVQSKFTLFLGLSYPNTLDAERGLKAGFITAEDFQKIKSAIDRGKRPDWETGLGGKIGIHGKGSAFDWTAGCISLEDENIKTLWEYTQLGTSVKIMGGR